MELLKKTCIAIALLLGALHTQADEGMWVLKELNEQGRARMRELGFNIPFEQLYSETDPCIANAVVIFGRGCTGITVSEQGLIFTNHHCGYGAIQQLSSVEHDYLKNGFVSQSFEAELPVPGLSVRYLKETVDVTARIMAVIGNETDEFRRISMADSVGRIIADSVGKDPFIEADVFPFYNRNKYFLIVYKVFNDVRLVFTPPSSIGKFGGDTDNWMYPRHTGDFSVFRVYADGNNQPAEYSASNKPYRPAYIAKVATGYAEGDYAMTVGFPGRTDRYLSSWGVRQRIENSNKPRIEVRGIKQDIWREAMQASDAVRIKYASKYAGSSNYWKNSIGMNRGLANLNVIERKQAEEAAFRQWVEADAKRKATYGDVLSLLEQGYTKSDEYRKHATYLQEALFAGTEIVQLGRMINGIDVKGSTPGEIDTLINERLAEFFKDYDAALDQKVLAAMMRIVKERIPAKYLPDVYQKIDRKYKGDYAAYAADLFKRTQLLSTDRIAQLLKDKKRYDKAVKNDPALVLAQSVSLAFFNLYQQISDASGDLNKGTRLYLAGLQEMHPDKAFYSDANFSMRLSYGSIGGYRPYDAGWYNYFSTHQGLIEKEDATSPEFWVQPEIMALVKARDFGPYANENGDLQLCFLTNNDITGGNSGSPIFDKNGCVIGLAFDGNWEAMSGDIAFEPELQRCIGVDMRYMLFMIDKWGRCPRLIQELKFHQ